jgi:(p)ppGpp synthase/HD superfamily hydrolase
MATLERAIAIAAQAHTGQLRMDGEPYILHPLRVMMRVGEMNAKIVAVLHDVVEDSAWTLDQLRSEGFAAEVVGAVDAVTHRQGEDYFAYVSRAAADPLARQVKLADLEDNMDIRRISHVRDKDLERVRRYHTAWISLKTGC